LLSHELQTVKKLIKLQLVKNQNNNVNQLTG